MAILSFAHLKKGSPQQPHIAPPASRSMAPTITPASTSGKPQAMSFAHLKAKTAKEIKTSPTTVQEQPNIRLQRPRGIGVEKTAIIASANYCEGCPRFWPADEMEMEMGVLYGRCCRSGAGEDVEVWRIIPLTTRVARCWYHQQGK